MTIKGRAIHVRNRLTAWRADATRYAASPQELPALYTTGRTYRVFTYDGRRPYTGAPLHEVTEDAGGFFSPGPSWLATEHWAAVVDDGGFGIGLFKPDLVRFAGTPGTPGGGWVNGYLAASTTEVIDANQVYDYDYALVVGSLRQIRAYAYANRPDARPDYRFRTDRQHWWYSGATDRGSPVRGALRFLVGTTDATLHGPEGWWRARSVPVVYVRARWVVEQLAARLAVVVVDTALLVPAQSGADRPHPRRAVPHVCGSPPRPGRVQRVDHGARPRCRLGRSDRYGGGGRRVHLVASVRRRPEARRPH